MSFYDLFEICDFVECEEDLMDKLVCQVVYVKEMMFYYF